MLIIVFELWFSVLFHSDDLSYLMQIVNEQMNGIMSMIYIHDECISRSQDETKQIKDEKGFLWWNIED